MATYKQSSAIPLDKSSYFGAMEKEGRGAISNMGALVAERERMRTAIENSNRQRQEVRDASNAAGQAQFSALGAKEASGGIYDWITGSPTKTTLTDNMSISGARTTAPITTQPSTVGGSTLPTKQLVDTTLTNTAIPVSETAMGTTLGTANTTGSALESAGLYGEMANVGAGTEAATAGATTASTATTATEGASLLSSGSAGTGAAFSTAGAVAGGLGAAYGAYNLATSKKARKSPGTWLQTAGGISMMIPGGQLLGGASMGIGALMNAFGWEI